MKNPFKPLLDELKIRKRENEELHISLLQEIERLKTNRENKPKSKFRKISFVDNIANKIATSNDEKALKIFQEQKRKELAIIREQRKNDYRISIFALLGLFVIIIALITTIGAFCEKSNSDKVNNVAVEQELNTEDFNDNDNVLSEKESVDNDLSVDNEKTIEVENDTHKKSEVENESDSEYSEQNIIVSESTKSSNVTNNVPAAYSTESSNVTNNVPSTYSNERMVWIPTNGGKKYHSKQSCSNMKNPKEISLEQAIENGFTACQKCS